MKVVGHFSQLELAAREKDEKNSRRAKRLRIISLAMEGWTAPAIATAVGLSRRGVQSWVYRFNDSGLDGLQDQRGQVPGIPLSPEQEQQFRQRLKAGPRPEDQVCSLRGLDIQKILSDELGLIRSLSSVYWLLHRLGYSSLQPRPRHLKTDPVAVQEFQESLPQRLEAVAAEHPDKQLRIYFQDEARFGQQGTLTRLWAETGSRPTAVRQTEYQYLWVLGAVCPETRHAEGLLSPRLNTQVVNAFLEQFSLTFQPNEQALMIWDGAGFHRSKTLKIPANVSIIQLPAYSPELNPIENLWHYLKSHHWSNRAYAGDSELETASVAAWKKSVLNSELTKTVCAAPWLKRAVSE